MKPVWIFGLAMLSATSASAFDVDMQKGDVRTLIGRPSIADLGVGEMGKLDFIRLCADGAGIFIYTADLLSESRDGFGVVWTIKRVPGGSFALTGTSIRSNLLLPFTIMPPCASFAGLQDQLAPISTINGQATLSGLVKSLE